MSISSLRMSLKGIPDIGTLKMIHEEGGRIEVYSTASKTIRVKAGAKDEEIRAAFEAQ